ncbi:hypothetical protein DFH09DRAFT_1473842 [Mycena vulgaris]|nr:hypothetical protein DFH09DRAFT_1473842 [Mycena vulgaris]
MPRRNNRKGKRNKIKIGSTARRQTAPREGEREVRRRRGEEDWLGVGVRVWDLEVGIWRTGGGFGDLGTFWLWPGKISGQAKDYPLAWLSMAFWPEAKARKSLGGAEVDGEDVQGGRGGEGCEEGCCSSLSPPSFPQAGNSCALARLSHGKMHSMIVRKQEVDAVLWGFFHSLRRGIVLGATYHPALAKHVSVTTRRNARSSAVKCAAAFDCTHGNILKSRTTGLSLSLTRGRVASGTVSFGNVECRVGVVGHIQMHHLSPIPVQKKYAAVRTREYSCPSDGIFGRRDGECDINAITHGDAATRMYKHTDAHLLRRESATASLRSMYSGNGPSLQREWFALS